LIGGDRGALTAKREQRTGDYNNVKTAPVAVFTIGVAGGDGDSPWYLVQDLNQVKQTLPAAIAWC
jgi:hypothetical protein